MKESPRDRAQRINLGPSKFSGEGFMGNDPRTVPEIVADDQRALDAAGVSRETLVKSLREAYARAREELGNEVEVAPGINAVFHESMGRIPSPFRADGSFEKGDVVVANTARAESITITALGISLIEHHGFFQGSGSPYRVEPLAAARVLGLC